MRDEEDRNREATGEIERLTVCHEATNAVLYSTEDIQNAESILSAAMNGRSKAAHVLDYPNNGHLTYPVGEVIPLLPVASSVPLIAFQNDPALARDEAVIVTVKTTLQVDRNARQLEQKAKPNPDVFGRERPRRYVPGLVAALSLCHDSLDWAMKNCDWAFSALEPYALDAHGSKMALAGGSYVKIINFDTATETALRHPWLSQVHSVQFSAAGNRLLVASAGFDAVIEFDLDTGKSSWEWFAWEHGFDRSALGHHVVRSGEARDALTAIGHEVILVDNPLSYPFGVATRYIPAHLNSALYDADGRVLVTLFHQGAGITIDRASGEVRELISGLVNPHKLSRRRQGGYFVSDTRRGKLVLIDEGYRRSEISLSGLPGVGRSPVLGEFLQNATEVKDGLFACVDIHRNSLWLVDVKRRKYRGVKFPLEWSVHDVAVLGQEHRSKIGQLVGKTFDTVQALNDERQKVIRHFTPGGREIETISLDTKGHAKQLDVAM
jgi:hypothetical protein